jgi:hypothetical protein
MSAKSLPAATEPLAMGSDQAAESIGLQSPTLEKDRREGHLGIPYVRAGRRVIYQLSDLRAWLAANRVTPGAGVQCTNCEVDHE